jgi:integrase
MLHGQDLLNLVVGDVQSRNGSIRPVIEIARARGMPPVRCALSKTSTKALEKWISASGKKRTDYLFPGHRRSHGPMTIRNLSRLLKDWVAEAGLDPADYSIESFPVRWPEHSTGARRAKMLAEYGDRCRVSVSTQCFNSACAEAVA